MSSIKDQVIAIVSEKLSVDKEKIHEGSSFIGDLGADSLDMVELLMNLEDSFKMTIPDEDAEGIKTVGDAVKYIEQHQGQE
ncbi:MAG: acyl carrier protein [Planctomycetota bacterium]